MAGNSVWFDGVDELNHLAADLGKVGAQAVAAGSAAVRKTAYDIEADAKAFCPVDTGNLRNSISSTVGVLAAEIGPTTDYASYVEYGTSTQAPQAFMGPAFDRRAGQLQQVVDRIIDGTSGG